MPVPQGRIPDPSLEQGPYDPPRPRGVVPTLRGEWIPSASWAFCLLGLVVSSPSQLVVQRARGEPGQPLRPGRGRGLLGAGGGLLAQLLQPGRQEVLRGTPPGGVGGLGGGGNGVLAVRVVPEPAPVLLGPVRPVRLGFGFLGPSEPPQRAGPVLRQRRLNGLERGEGEHGRGRVRVLVQLAGSAIAMNSPCAVAMSAASEART